MKRKILWDVWLLPEGMTPIQVNGVNGVEVEFETINVTTFQESEILWKDARKALKDYMMNEYPGMKYEVLYWDWLN